MVAASQISDAVGQSWYSGVLIRPMPAPNFRVCSIEQVNVTPQPSEPMLTLMPASRSARKSAAPEPIDALLQGLYWTLAPDRAINARSCGDNQTP